MWEKCLQVAQILDERLKKGHFMLYLGSRAGSKQGGMEAMYASLDDPALAETTVAATQNHPNTAHTEFASSGSEQQSRLAADTGMEAMVASFDDHALVRTTAAATQNQLNTARTEIDPVSGGSEQQSRLAADTGCSSQSDANSHTEVQQGERLRAHFTQDSAAFAERVARLCAESNTSDADIRQLHLDLKRLDLGVRRAAANNGKQKDEPTPAALQINPEAPQSWSLLRLKECGEKGRRGRRMQKTTRIPLS